MSFCNRLSKVGFALLLLSVVAQPSLAQEPLKQEKTFLRVKIAGRDIRLETLIVKPDAGDRKLPLALITHGQSPSTIGMGEMTALRYANVARDLARRGWLAAVVLRRGAGQSDGRAPVEPVTCASIDFSPIFASDGIELEAALQALQRRDDVDPTRAIALGESAGGAGVIALGNRQPPGLRGVINVAGGRYRDGCMVQSRPSLVKAIGALSQKANPPQLWIYAKNDETFPGDLVDKMVSLARDGGADIRLVELPDIKPNGHLIFRHGIARFTWLREMDTSLRAWDLPTWKLADVQRIYAKLGLTDGVDSFERYFSAPGEKAMAISRDKKQFRYWFGNDTLDRAKELAMRDCGKVAEDCALAFENDRFLLE